MGDALDHIDAELRRRLHATPGWTRPASLEEILASIDPTGDHDRCRARHPVLGLRCTGRVDHPYTHGVLSEGPGVRRQRWWWVDPDQDGPAKPDQRMRPVPDALLEEPVQLGLWS